MTRKQERSRRFALWGGIVLAGAIGGVALGGWPGLAFVGVALAIGHRVMILPPGVAVLTYHSVAKDPAWLPWADEIAVAPDTFVRHLDTLIAMRCNVLATRDYIARRERGAPLPPRAAILHFDDGYLDNWLNAVPALIERGMPATFFPSLSFVEPGDVVRCAAADSAGYMNWPELKAIERIRGLEVEPHGVDHGRVPISDRAVDTLTRENWRKHAWVQWRAIAGPRHDWFRQDEPVAVPLGSAVPESALALASPAVGESFADLEARITDHLTSCRTAFEHRIGRAPQVFCWPENAAAPAGRRIAAALGYRATTGGRCRNTADEPPAVISRIHMGDRALGFRWLPAEGLHVQAATRLAQGNLYWYLVVGPMNLTRAMVGRLRRWRRS